MSHCVQGVTILDTAIRQQLSAGKDELPVLGFSQSSIIASLEMENLDPSGSPRARHSPSFSRCSVIR